LGVARERAGFKPKAAATSEPQTWSRRAQQSPSVVKGQLTKKSPANGGAFAIHSATPALFMNRY
jgi:hypothetical protein